ncbi:hypothetical protein LTR10_013478 [Elasticomyces elasticus]|uniref:Nucleoside phosphorylase domain-containing protein n=1 Tax=Exophiala sideris TaxID=1016849 RepID=A0ABR0JPT9_9EURO|nr:hypothetical protein LTR10_013478 [Elasticomyces elasticus]KAK5039613.1 hypothetical protein LTS07_000107 [Exophiala sideris]KAK5041165.1 hypothetical protein LTR13_002639 [Exophiala sideris]KAK5067990.1 hypothetical protein LTR69_000107 [Exophiala sideris]KAK5187292.1 hypothetical protein LTR44_000107 [Eurotiomycetes sp. CCFEE 6388]
MTAALSMLDEAHPVLEGQQQQDNNTYALGRIHSHKVVVACMPAGADGLVNAANVARDMARTFTSLRVCLMVGIGGGIPNLPKGIDIRLGDVVVSQPDGTWGGVVQYDKGKAEDGGRFVMKGQLNQPPPVLLQTLARLKAEHGMRDSRISRYMNEAIERYPKMVKTGYMVPAEPDRLYCKECDQDIENVATKCTASHIVREERSDNSPVIHYGIIASGNLVIKDAGMRDNLRDRFGALCVEMEAAGLMNHVPCLVIRGICDYADFHKNDAWHSYAAIAAAAYAKEFLYFASPTQASSEKPMQQVLGLLDGLSHTLGAQLAVSQEVLEVAKEHLHQKQTQYESDEHARCHQAFKTCSYEEYKNINPPRMPNTCKWVLDHPKYREWYESSRDDLLWITADPGCGKSVLAKSLIENELQSTDTHMVCYFFFKDNEQQDNVATALCAILHQLFSHQRHLIRHAIPAWKNDGIRLLRETSTLWQILLAAAGDPESKNVTCVLDALDECDELEGRKILRLLTEFYGQIFSSPSMAPHGRLKMLVTSRPYEDIHHGFRAIPSDLPTIQLRGEDENDKISKEIDLVIYARVAELTAELRLDATTKHRVETKLLQIEHRTYLWVHLATDDIYHTFRKSLRRNQQSIRYIPSTVEQAYEKILTRVEEGERATVKGILQIVVGARRPITINEMAIALGIATSTDAECLSAARVDHDGLGDRIRDLCGLFVFITTPKSI